MRHSSGDRPLAVQPSASQVVSSKSYFSGVLLLMPFATAVFARGRLLEIV